MAGMIIGIVALVWAIIPLLGAAAWWLALVGLILSVVAFFMAKSGKNPKKGGIVTGIILNVVALALAIFWIYKIASGISEGLNNPELRNAFENALDTAKLNEAMHQAMDSLNNAH